ncbi:hypothetical protein GCM10011408_29450 [Dyella caseinilytica]|nr:hypothetical protein GCM10011408_29450 [Dyella caseinilytica]
MRQCLEVVVEIALDAADIGDRRERVANHRLDALIRAHQFHAAQSAGGDQEKKNAGETKQQDSAQGDPK